MKYTQEDLINALFRLDNHITMMLSAGIRLPKICEMVAVDMFIDTDNWPDTDLQFSRDITLLKKALRDLQQGGFKFTKGVGKDS